MSWDEEIEDDKCVYEPDKKIDRYHALKDIMFDNRTIKEVVKTLRGDKRILYKDLQIGKVYYHVGKKYISHQDIEYNIQQIGDLTVFEFVNTLPGLEDIEPSNVTRLDKKYYEKKMKGKERNKNQDNILETINMSLMFKQIRTMYKPATVVFANGLGVVISLENDGVINVNNNGMITIFDGSGFDTLPFYRLIEFIFTSEHFYI